MHAATLTSYHHAASRSVLMTVIIALLVGLAGRMQAQSTGDPVDPRETGSTYVIAFPDTTTNKYDPRQDTDPRFRKREPQNDSISVAIYTPTDNRVQITGYGGYSVTLAMNAGDFRTVYLNGAPRASAPIVEESGVVNGKTFRIEAESPVVVYCFIITKFGTEAFTPTPVDTWGSNYYAAALPGEVLYDELQGGENNYGKTPKAGPSEILVIAAFDSTKVTIVPNGKLDKNPRTTVTLMKDQCYQVQSYVDTNAFNLGNPQPDLGGSYISATKPIGVISGNTRAQVIDNRGGLAENSFKNMMIEWLRSVDQHGTKFVYTPTWDDWRLSGAGGEDPATKRPGEIVRVYATAGRSDESTPTATTVNDFEGLGGAQVGNKQIDRSKFYETLIGTSDPHYFTTDHPAQAFMNTVAVVRFDGTTGGGNFVGATYTSEGTYMAELIPVEQWTYASPYVTPEYPATMTHYLNIVADSSSRGKISINGQAVLINRHISGTPYYWGTRTLIPGEKGVIRGADTSVRFTATVYGEVKGIETYRPGRTRKRDDGSETGALHPSEYEENIGVMYGYPVAPAHSVLRGADSLRISTSTRCDTLDVTITTLNANPSGLRSITFDSATNAKVVIVLPAPPQPVTGSTSAELYVVPVDPKKDASGVLIIQDRTGKIWRVPYSYTAHYLEADPQAGFGLLDAGNRNSRTVVVRNPSRSPVQVSASQLASPSAAFRIDSTKPALPVTLGPGDSITVYITFTPPTPNRDYEDTLWTTYDCGFVPVKLRGRGAMPCLMVDDLDFGVSTPGQEILLPLSVCNKGIGEITFNAPYLSWNSSAFEVSEADIDKLKNARLGPNDCVTITVHFRAELADSYRDVARFWASTRDCKDTSVWSANAPPAGVAGGSGTVRQNGLAIAVDPNPFSATAIITVDLDAVGRTSVEIFNAAGARVASLADETLDAGSHVYRWDAGALPSGIYFCRVHAGDRVSMRPMLLVR